MEDFKTPGVYIREVPKFPPSVAQVETAIPAFIGYTQLVAFEGESLLNKPVRISSLAQYSEIFGGAYKAVNSAKLLTVGINAQGQITGLGDWNTLQTFKMYQSLQMYFANGGGACYIVSVGDYFNGAVVRAISEIDIINGLNAVAKEDEPTLLVFPDATGVTDIAKYHSIFTTALTQCFDLKDRFTICDIQNAGQANLAVAVASFRDGIGVQNLNYGAVYHPYIKTIINFDYDETAITFEQALHEFTTFKLNELKEGKAPAKKITNTSLYEAIKKEISKQTLILPPSSTMAGVYASVDGTRGVWKSPANFSLNYTKELTIKIDEETQKDLNVHTSGKSINALRFFGGKGNLVWGARTLAGNDNEWRYISVRRFFIMVEESVKKASEPMVFEPNDANTWVKVKGMIENFLFLQWRAGALAGMKPQHAYFVNVGLGITMTALDILEGRMIVEIGMAAVRPAEFIILRFSHKMQES
jgi:uncharacterized protein